MLSQAAVFLDAGSMGEDLSLNRLMNVLLNLKTYPHTSKEQVNSRLKDVELVIVNKVKLNESHFQHLPKLKLICLTATGSDNIDIKSADKHGITVCNIKGYSVNSVPQHALTLMLMLATQAHQYVADVRKGVWFAADHFSLLHHPIVELKAKTLGIAGYGTLGQQLEKLAAPFDMKVLLCNLPGRPKQNGRLDLSELLPQVDFLSLHCPLTDQTEKMLGEKEFKLMKPTSFLINTARGQLVDEQALATALKNGDIGGAGIDVLSQEPPSADHPLLDPQIPNLIMTPHNAWGSIESRKKLLDILITNIECFFQGKPQNVVSSD